MTKSKELSSYLASLRRKLYFRWKKRKQSKNYICTFCEFSRKSFKRDCVKGGWLPRSPTHLALRQSSCPFVTSRWRNASCRIRKTMRNVYIDTQKPRDSAWEELSYPRCRATEWPRFFQHRRSRLWPTSRDVALLALLFSSPFAILLILRYFCSGLSLFHSSFILYFVVTYFSSSQRYSRNEVVRSKWTANKNTRISWADLIRTTFSVCINWSGLHTASASMANRHSISLKFVFYRHWTFVRNVRHCNIIIRAGYCDVRRSRTGSRGTPNMGQVW